MAKWDLGPLQSVGDLVAENQKMRAALNTAEAEREAAEAKLAQAVELLIERDGGRHDDDCKYLRSIGRLNETPCNCGHVETCAFLGTVQPEGEPDDKPPIPWHDEFAQG